jgi:hypothetical protein
MQPGFGGFEREQSHPVISVIEQVSVTFILVIIQIEQVTGSRFIISGDAVTMKRKIERT